MAGGLGELGAAAGRAGAAGLSGAAAGLGAAPLAGVSAGEASAFFTERIALLGAAPAGAVALGWAEPPFEIKDRIFAASSSLIELLWLFAATPSWMAASSTSLLSRPMSLDSS
jgi:hypothetical protein